MYFILLAFSVFPLSVYLLLCLFCHYPLILSLCSFLPFYNYILEAVEV